MARRLNSFTHSFRQGLCQVSSGIFRETMSDVEVTVRAETTDFPRCDGSTLTIRDNPSRLCPSGLGTGIFSTAVGGWLRSGLQTAATLFNLFNGSWGMVKVQFSKPLDQSQLAARRLDFNHPPTAVGGD